MINVLFLISSLLSPNGGDIHLTRVYSLPHAEPTMVRPYAISMDSESNLYVLDRETLRVYIWKKDGSFNFSFGGPGQGPGELNFATRIDVEDDRIYVQDQGARKFKVFDKQGHELTNIPFFSQVENFVALKNGNILLAHYDPPDKMRKFARFAVVNSSGETVKELKFPNTCILSTDPYKRKGYCGNVEIQKTFDGRVILGYSEDNKLYSVNAEGAFEFFKSFQLPTQDPSLDDIEKVKNGELGTTVGFTDFSYPKAYYSHFLIRGNQIVFVQNPLGNWFGSGTGFYYGTYVICDLNTGAVLHSGRYSLDEDASVIYTKGRIFAIVPNAEGDFEIWDAGLEGLKPLSADLQ